MQNGLKTLRIGFLCPMQKEWMGGVTYFRNLFYAISELNKISDDIILQPCIDKPDDNIVIETFRNLCAYTNIKEIKTFKYYFNKLYKKVIFKKFNKEKYCKYIRDIDLISHSQEGRINNLKTISWISDFQHLHLKEMFSPKEIATRNKLFKRQITSSDIIILSSYDALNDYKNFAPKYIDKARVLHFISAINSEIYQKTDEMKDEIIKKFELPNRYFYVPNQFWKHKNHIVIFEALSKLKQEGIEVNVVFTGYNSDYRCADYFNQLISYAKDNGIYNQIKILGLVNQIEVYYLMRNCISIINPSLFEGWSSTVEEAKSIGKNIILSDLNVHKEQNPDNGIYFEPHDSNHLKEILKDKWINGKSSPDYELEDAAKLKMHSRILEYAKEYKKIIMEIIEDKKG